MCKGLGSILGTSENKMKKKKIKGPVMPEALVQSVLTGCFYKGLIYPKVMYRKVAVTCYTSVL